MVIVEAIETVVLHIEDDLPASVALTDAVSKQAVLIHHWPMQFLPMSGLQLGTSYEIKPTLYQPVHQKWFERRILRAYRQCLSLASRRRLHQFNRFLFLLFFYFPGLSGVCSATFAVVLATRSPTACWCGQQFYIARRDQPVPPLRYEHVDRVNLDGEKRTSTSPTPVS